MQPLSLPPSDIAPHTVGELRAAYQERINEASLNAETLLKGLRYAEDEQALELLRFLLKRDECMRISLEQVGAQVPPALDFHIEEGPA